MLKLIGGKDSEEAPTNSGNERVFTEMETRLKNKLVGTMKVAVKIGKEGKTQAQVMRELENRSKL